MFVLLIACFVFNTAHMPAWDAYKLTGYIAWAATPAARERAISILLSAPEDADLSVFSRRIALAGDELQLFYDW